ncbi:cellulose binding domain-containing protein [Phytohabitans rumicis]|uniref:CBM2 domain-containing protein n=1 Tax=Phytohabitans rumicis TaxID=1076125 RepID=A0A6V8LCU2_9ACTN|nr:cellulose binding domain-containing protein [Phytohabitans rumicis]GFJ92611.1 hypothetical protein Prum_062530 [Phytohabitans rumicis]
MKKSILYAVLTALALVTALVVARPALSAAAPVRIMPLGDSITGGPGCWRALLWDRLQRTGYTDIDFVGTLPGGGCSVAHDGDNEGHGGYQAVGIADQNQLPPWLAATSPDIVLMHLGTNDVWNNRPAATILAAYGKLVDQMRANNPNMRIIVAQIVAMAPTNCTYCTSGVIALNNAIPGWAAGKSTTQSPITVVDQWTGFDPVADTIGDGVHPDDSGFQKMSDRWYPAVTRALGGTTTPTTPPVTTAPATTAPPAPGVCTATYRVVSQWTGGFQGEVTVRNGGTTSTSAWTAAFSFANGQRVSQAWNATVTQSGAAVTARHLSWNGLLTPGGTATFGFIASWTGTNAVPAVTCTLT